jgi:hypothetical protein
MYFLVPLIVIANMAAPVAQTQYPESQQEELRQQRTLIVDEVHVEQEKGRISAKSKTPEPAGNTMKTVPEGQAAAVPPGPSNPATCDPKNASSPACYAATQQGRGK